MGSFSDAPGKVAASVVKELKLILRDRGGLALLFLMPAALVLVVSLVQDNVMKATGEIKIEALIVDRDGGELGKKVRNLLEDSETIKLADELDGEPLTESKGLAALAQGRYQLMISIPEGFTQGVRDAAKSQVAGSLGVDIAGGEFLEVQGVRIVVRFDPTVRGRFRGAVLNGVEKLVFGLEMEEKGRVFGPLLKERMAETVKSISGPYWEEGMGDELAEVDFGWTGKRVLTVEEDRETLGEMVKFPTSVQQNVPAWTIFGMFFVVVPLAGALIRERSDGLLRRLMAMPVSFPVILSGKVIAYLVICQLQFVLMLLVGKFVLPALGTPVFELGEGWALLIVVSLASGLAATGYGVLVGSLCRSYEQASMLGPVSVVIAAAIGGIMVPVYVMPTPMRNLSRLSPLGWGHDGFMDVYLRSAGLGDIAPKLAGLVAFFAVCMLVSFLAFARSRR